jgi:hypothetical protein
MYDEKDPTAEPYIILRDDWKTTPVYSGDTVNIVGWFSSDDFSFSIQFT